MTAFTKSTTDRLREAVAMVRGNPSAVEALDADERRKHDEAAKEAKRLSDARAKVERDLPALVEEIVNDVANLEAAARRAAVEKRALAVLNLRHGVVSPKVMMAAGGMPSLRPSFEDIAREYRRLAQRWPLPGSKGVSAAAYQATQSREAAAALDAQKPKVVTADEAIEARKRQLHEQRQRTNEARKREAGLTR